MRHRKVAQLAIALRLRRSHVIGHLHALWHAALEQQDDGDLSGWSDEFIAEASDFPGDAPQYVRLLQEVGWLDGKLLHDWPDYAGAFLRNRYASGHRPKLVEIWSKHGKSYGLPAPSNNQPTSNQQGANCTVPDPPDQPYPTNSPPTPAKRGKREPLPAIPEALASSPEFVAAWEEWVGHRSEIRHPLTSRAAKMNLKQCSEIGPARAIAAIHNSIGGSYQKLVEPYAPKTGKNADCSEIDAGIAAALAGSGGKR